MIDRFLNIRSKQKMQSHMVLPMIKMVSYGLRYNVTKLADLNWVNKTGGNIVYEITKPIRT